MAGCMKMTTCYLSKSVQLMLFTVILTCLPRLSHQDTEIKYPIFDLHDGEIIAKLGTNRFCYKNSIVPTWKQAWTRIQVKVWRTSVFKVEGEEELQQLDRFSVLGWFHRLLRKQHNETSINVNPYNKKMCFKVEPDDSTPYTVKLLRKFDISLFLLFLAGGVLLFFADSLSRSQAFFYAAGMGTGMIAPLVILFFILACFLPTKSPFHALIVGGWSFSVYAIQLVFRNLSIIMQEHWRAALGYMIVVGFISFAAITVYRKLRRYVYWKPEPRHLLTEEEYQKEGEEETRRALDELRKYCHSPECNPWKAVSRLQSPKRFVDFIEGSPHLTANEASVHVQEYGF